MWGVMLVTRVADRIIRAACAMWRPTSRRLLLWCCVGAVIVGGARVAAQTPSQQQFEQARKLGDGWCNYTCDGLRRQAASARRITNRLAAVAVLLDGYTLKQIADEPAQHPRVRAAATEQLSRHVLGTRYEAIPADALRTASGFAYRIESQGQGDLRPSISDTDFVILGLKGWNSKDPAREPSRRFGNGTVSRLPWTGLRELLTSMTVGGRALLWLPASPENRRAPAGDPDAAFLLEVTLINLIHLPPVPADVDQAPPDAQSTGSTAGDEDSVRFKTLVPGTGTAHPASDSAVSIEQTGWAKESGRWRVFTSTETSHSPVKTDLAGVEPPGLREGIASMVVGEVRRIWVPENKAFDGRPKGRWRTTWWQTDIHGFQEVVASEDWIHDTDAVHPAGSLVYDVKLVGIGPAGRASKAPGLRHPPVR